MRVGSAGEYESFEHIQKLCVASANKFHSCLSTLKTCSYRVCRTAYAPSPTVPNLLPNEDECKQ